MQAGDGLLTSIQANYGMQYTGKSGVEPWRQRVEYETYRSPYGPQYGGSALILAGDGILSILLQIQDPTSLPRHQPYQWHKIVR